MYVSAFILIDISKRISSKTFILMSVSNQNLIIKSIIFITKNALLFIYLFIVNRNLKVLFLISLHKFIVKFIFIFIFKTTKIFLLRLLKSFTLKNSLKKLYKNFSFNFKFLRMLPTWYLFYFT